MNLARLSRTVGACAVFAVACQSAAYAEEKPVDTPPAPPATGLKSEAKVQRIVTEDENVHVDELRVRGETRRIVVQSRLGANGKVSQYEVLPADNGRDMSQGPAGKRDGAGKRVWQVMAF